MVLTFDTRRRKLETYVSDDPARDQVLASSLSTCATTSLNLPASKYDASDIPCHDSARGALDLRSETVGYHSGMVGVTDTRSLRATHYRGKPSDGW